MRSAFFDLDTIPSHFRYFRSPISTSEAEEQLSDYNLERKASFTMQKQIILVVFCYKTMLNNIPYRIERLKCTFKLLKFEKKILNSLEISLRQTRTLELGH